ncbi:serine protease inhibitor 3/4 isoform X4 [Tribolium castaneum]|uniref:serine protease inhibitor 3/4 isoform X4 n=1 Tax=Tribolium castaneum TaxID=7070 RepID=UPI0030FE0FB6
MITVIKTRALTFQKFQTLGKIYFSSVLVILGLVFGILLSASTMAEIASELQVLQGNNQFTSKMYKLLSQKKGNIIFSPISMHAVLSMAYQGAQGSTAEHFASTLQVPEAKIAAEGYSEVMKRLNSVQNVTLLMANKVFLKNGFTLLTDFETAVTKSFQSEVQLVDFAQNEAAAKTINDWVEVQTREKIKDLIKKDDLNELTRLVLVNAIYFKGNWKHKFRKEETRTEPFYLNDVDKVEVQMMHTKNKFNYKNDEALDAQILEMPYTNENLSMVIILPNQRNGIGELEKKLENYNLSEITTNMWNTEVNVALPKFKIEQTIDLEEALKKLGLGEIFDQDKANFRGMIELKPNENLYVSKVIQKAFIEVNEEGAEAAAATGLIWAVDSLPVHQDLCFNVDHSFIILLSENLNKRTSTLFMGKILKPQIPF